MEIIILMDILGYCARWDGIKILRIKQYYKLIMRWLELDDRTNVPSISEDDAQENCKPFPNNVVSVTTIPPESS